MATKSLLCTYLRIVTAPSGQGFLIRVYYLENVVRFANHPAFGEISRAVLQNALNCAKIKYQNYYVRCTCWKNLPIGIKSQEALTQ